MIIAFHQPFLWAASKSKLIPQCFQSLERELGDFRAGSRQGQGRGRLKAGYSDPWPDDPKGPPCPARQIFKGRQAPAAGFPCAAIVSAQSPTPDQLGANKTACWLFL